MKISFTIPGKPRTKKNSGWRTKYGGKQMPSKAYLQWDSDAQKHLLKWAVRNEEFLNWCSYNRYGPDPCSAMPMNCQAIFYRDALRGDAVGYYQALADTLQKFGLVKNDSLIEQWDGSRLLKDAKNPRIEVTLETIK